jgi:hypothetical protein
MSRIKSQFSISLGLLTNENGPDENIHVDLLAELALSN